MRFDFDPSTLSYEDFVLYFLTRPLTDWDWRMDAAGEEFTLIEIRRPEIIARNLTQFFNESSQYFGRVSVETLDHALTGMLSSAFFNLQSALWDDRVDLEERVLCIRSMYEVFSDFVTKCNIPVLPACFYMWWDYVCTSFWNERTYAKKIAAEEYGLLDESDRQLVDAMFETLCEILRIDNGLCQAAALHGLGHVHHPGVRSIVQKYMDTHAVGMTLDETRWLESCRDGVAM